MRRKKSKRKKCKLKGPKVLKSQNLYMNVELGGYAPKPPYVFLMYAYNAHLEFLHRKFWYQSLRLGNFEGVWCWYKEHRSTGLGENDGRMVRCNGVIGTISREFFSRVCARKNLDSVFYISCVHLKFWVIKVT